MKSSWGGKGDRRDNCDAAYTYGNMLAVILKLRCYRIRGWGTWHYVTKPEGENNEVLKECDTEQRGRSHWVGGDGGSRQTAFINSICFCKRVWLCDLCWHQPSSIIFTHYGRADKIRDDTCLRERLNAKWMLCNSVNFLSVSKKSKKLINKNKRHNVMGEKKRITKLMRLEGVSRAHNSWH